MKLHAAVVALHWQVNVVKHETASQVLDRSW